MADIGKCDVQSGPQWDSTVVRSHSSAKRPHYRHPSRCMIYKGAVIIVLAIGGCSRKITEAEARKKILEADSCAIKDVRLNRSNGECFVERTKHISEKSVMESLASNLKFASNDSFPGVPASAEYTSLEFYRESKAHFTVVIEVPDPDDLPRIVWVALIDKKNDKEVTVYCDRDLIETVEQILDK